LPYDKPVQLQGRLEFRDEGGYRKYSVLKPQNAICTKQGKEQWEAPITHVTELHAYTVDDEQLSDRLERLTGTLVKITGELSPAVTGYQRTDVVIQVQRVEPLDAAGARALRTPRQGVVVKDVESFTAIIRTGPRLVLEAKDNNTGEALNPADRYVHYWMNGGDGLWVRCPDRYERVSEKYSSEDAGFCVDELCVFPNVSKLGATLTIACVRSQ
jgi:hypothetical protein